MYLNKPVSLSGEMTRKESYIFDRMLIKVARRSYQSTKQRNFLLNISDVAWLR